MEAVQFAACYTPTSSDRIIMLTLICEEKSRDIVEPKKRAVETSTNVISFSSKAKSDKKSQHNVLAAAKKLKW